MFVSLSLCVTPSTPLLSPRAVWMFHFSLTLDTSLAGVTRGFHLSWVLSLWESSNWQTSALVRHHSLHLHRYEKCFNKLHWVLRRSGNCIPMAMRILWSTYRCSKVWRQYVDVLARHSLTKPQVWKYIDFERMDLQHSGEICLGWHNNDFHVVSWHRYTSFISWW